jgi:hypothetical protein
MRPVAWLGSGHKTGASSNTSLFPRLARAAPASPGLTQRVSWGLLLLTGQGWMTCLSSPQTYPSWGRLPRGVDWGPPRHVGVRCSAEHGGNDAVPQGVCMSLKTPTTLPRQQTLTTAVCVVGRQAPRTARTASISAPEAKGRGWVQFPGPFCGE